MSIKLAIILSAAILTSGCLVASYYKSGYKEWELLNHVPTSSVSESKRLGVYVSALNCSPKEADLGDTRYKIEEVWVEHKTEPERINLFMIRQKLYPDLVLCFRVSVVSRDTNLAISSIRVRTDNATRVYSPSASGNMCVDAGATIPSKFFLSSVAHGSETRIDLSR